MNRNQLFKPIAFFISVLFWASCFAQYKSTRFTNDHKFYYKTTGNHFATCDEIVVNDSIVSGYIIKDIRGQAIAMVSYKVGKLIADTANTNAALIGYTEVYFSKNIIACQVEGFACKQSLKQFFEGLLYDDKSDTLPKSFTYTYEIDYRKVDAYCEEKPIIYFETIEPIYNPVNDYYRLVKYTNDNATCNRKYNLSKPGAIKSDPKKYFPKKG